MTWLDIHNEAIQARIDDLKTRLSTGVDFDGSQLTTERKSKTEADLRLMGVDVDVLVEERRAPLESENRSWMLESLGGAFG